MKKMFRVLLAGLVLLGLPAYAEIATEDIGSEQLQPEETVAGYPFKIKMTGDWVDRARIKRHHSTYHVTFAAAAVDANLIYYYDACNKEALNAAVAYKKTYLNWHRNPYFNETNFDTISVILGGYSERLEYWTWRGQLSINFDNIEYWNFNDYMNYDITLWGRYDLCDTLGLHIGIFAQTGMKIDRVYPVIGVDWKVDDHIKLNLIYPLNISAVYEFNCKWSVALAGRFFDERHRVKKEAHLSQGLWSYRVVGIECALNYNPTDWISANIHAGSTVGGILKVANRNYNHRRCYDIDGSAYAGGTLSISF